MARFYGTIQGWSSGRTNVPQRVYGINAISKNIARCLHEMILYRNGAPSARMEPADSLEDYARWMMREPE